MNKDRNMPYGFAGPMQGNPLNPQMMNPQMVVPQGMSPIYENQYNEPTIQSRIAKIEKQMNRLEQRIMKLENISNTNNYNIPDNSMYMI